MIGFDRGRRIGVLLGATLAGCAQVLPRIAEDVDDLASRIQSRTGVDLSAWRENPNEPAIADAVATMLAQEMTEENAVRIALLNNRDVRARYEVLGVARADLVQAGLLSNPVFSIHALFFAGGGTELEFGLAQPFLDLFYRPLRIRIAEQEREVALAAVTHGLLALTFDVRRAFVDIRATQQLVAMQQQAMTAAVASHTLMRQLHAAGNVTDAVRTVERIGESRARIDLAAAEQSAREAREPLNVLLGLFGAATGWRVSGELADTAATGVDLDTVEGRCVAANLDLHANRARINIAAQRSGLASWEAWLPEAEIGVDAMREPDRVWGVGPTLGFEVPLFDAGGARIARERAILRHGIHRHAQIAVEVRAMARQQRERLSMLAARADFLRTEHVPALAQLVHETLQNYNAMQIGAFDVLARKQQEIAAQREQLRTLRDAWRARFDLEQLLAGSMHHEDDAMPWPEFGGVGVRDSAGGHE